MTSPTTAAGREFLHDLGTSVRPADDATGMMQKAMREQYDLDVAAIRKIEQEAVRDYREALRAALDERIPFQHSDTLYLSRDAVYALLTASAEEKE